MKSFLAILLSAGLGVQGWTLRTLWDMQRRVDRVEGRLGLSRIGTLQLPVQARETNQ